MFQALMDCSPRFYVFSKSQRMTLHYILLSKRAINDSIAIVNGDARKIIENTETD